VSCLLVDVLYCTVLYFLLCSLLFSSLLAVAELQQVLQFRERREKGPSAFGKFYGAQVFCGRNFPFSIFHSDSPPTDDSTVSDREQIDRYSVKSVVVAIPVPTAQPWPHLTLHPSHTLRARNPMPLQWLASFSPSWKRSKPISVRL
jgi:hypothetical protein